MTRRIVNIASVKKQDNMSQWVPTTPTNPAGAGAFTPASITATGTPIGVLFCPSARDLEQTNNDMDDRNQQLVFARGYKETCDMRVLGSVPFRWRRIVFSCKGLPALFQSSDPTFNSNYFQFESASGIVRQTTPLPSGGYGLTNAYLFKGQVNLDWHNPLQAKVDTQRVNLHYDKTVGMNPGNQTGSFHTYHHWFPINRNIMYSDDEAGVGGETSRFSSLAKPGIGDVFVYDLFESTRLSETDTLQVRFQGTWYWHEK